MHADDLRSLDRVLPQVQLHRSASSRFTQMGLDGAIRLPEICFLGYSVSFGSSPFACACAGGTYITRSDVLRRSSWKMAQANTNRSTRGGTVSQSVALQPKQMDAQTAKETKWLACTLSGTPLAEPLAADFLGSLYNREAVLEFLLGRAGSFADEQAQHRYLNQLREGGAAFEHLQSLRDVFAVRLTPAAGRAGAASSAGSRAAAARYVCPVTELPCTSYPFAALPGCGHAFSTRAVAQMPDGQCAVCSAAFVPEDVVALNGTAEQVEALRQRLDLRRAQARKGKARKKRRLDGTAAAKGSDEPAAKQLAGA